MRSPGDGWIAWTRSADRTLRPPAVCLELHIGECIQNHYEVDADERVIRVERAWSRKLAQEA